MSDARVEAIAIAAPDLLQKRNAWLNPPHITESELKKRTLMNLYNENPTWLQDAHHDLDEAVLAAYGWPINATDQDILGRLLELSTRRSSGRVGHSTASGA